MKNLANLMKQAQAMQSRMEEMQQALEAVEVEGSAGGGLVKAVLDGKGQLRRVRIDPSLADPAEMEVLEDLIVAAFSDAKAKADAHVAEEMEKVTGGLPIPPGMKLF